MFLYRNEDKIISFYFILNSIYFQISHHLNDGHFYKHTFLALFRQLSSTLPSNFVHWLKQFDFLLQPSIFFKVCAFYRFTFALIVNIRSSRRKKSHMDRSGERGGHARDRGIPHLPAHLTIHVRSLPAGSPYRQKESHVLWKI